MAINEYNSLLASVAVSTGETGYLHWFSFGSPRQSFQVAWSVAASAQLSAALEVTNRLDVSNGDSTGWHQVSAIAVDSVVAADGGQWQPLTGVVARRCRLRYAHNSGGAANFLAWIERYGPDFGG